VAGQSSLVTLNAYKARIYGAEIESNALLTGIDRIYASLALLHAKFVQFNLLGDSFSTGPVSYGGNNLPSAPPVTFALGYQHAI
jgi:iron complex outermembrane recepter protein